MWHTTHLHHRASRFPVEEFLIKLVKKIESLLNDLFLLGNKKSCNHLVGHKIIVFLKCMGMYNFFDWLKVFPGYTIYFPNAIMRKCHLLVWTTQLNFLSWKAISVFHSRWSYEKSKSAFNGKSIGFYSYWNCSIYVFFVDTYKEFNGSLFLIGKSINRNN